MTQPKSEQPEENQTEFKVVDRRPFNQDGQRRPDAETELPQPPPPAQDAARKATPKPPAAEPPTRSQESAPAQASENQPDEKAPGHFEQLVISLQATAMLQMGLAARPGEQPTTPDFAAAQQTIDLLTALQEKTQGNLTTAESDLLTGCQDPLRMAFVELTRHKGRTVG